MKTAPDRPRKKRRLWLWLIVVPILVLVTASAGAAVYFKRQIDRQLTRAIAEADRDDPNWRLPDLLAHRTPVPDPENSGPLVLSIAAEIPASWPPSDRIAGLSTVPPNALLTDDLTSDLCKELAKVIRPLAQARRLVDRPKGRYEVTLENDAIEFSLKHLQAARAASRLIQFDALLRAQEGDADGAITSIHAILNAGRSIGDEPLLISQLIRIAIVGEALQNLERVLAQGEPSEDVLARLQSLLDDEARQPRLLWGLRGERANAHVMLENFATGRVSVAEASGMSDAVAPAWLTPFAPMIFRANQATILHVYNDAITVARKPIDEQPSAWRAWEASSSLPGLKKAKLTEVIARLTVPSTAGAGQAEFRIHAMLRAATVLVACERHRRSHGQWPGSIAEIDPKILPEPPRDPYGSEPLRVMPTEFGLVIYAIGPDRVDNGGAVTDLKHYLEPGHDLGYRAWHVSLRRQPAPLPEWPENVFQTVPGESEAIP
ncbi:MAG: hypothetical protein JWN86_2614 [Planctomycetota bacterium]|nr:hypothetical protein [Planctomycetota bacterium]